MVLKCVLEKPDVGSGLALNGSVRTAKQFLFVPQLGVFRASPDPTSGASNSFSERIFDHDLRVESPSHGALRFKFFVADSSAGGAFLRF